MTETPEYKPSIFEKMIVPLREYQKAQTDLFLLKHQKPLPPDFQLRKTMFEAKMLAAEIEMKQILYPE